MTTGKTYYEPLTIIVGEREDGQMVRTVLERRLGVSRKLLSRLKLTDEGITLNGERVYTSVRVRAGDELSLRMEQEQSDDILPQEMPLDIVYEDPYLLVVNKPAGIVVHPTHGHYVNTLANGIVHHWLARGERVRFRPVHRLDRDTSGLVAVAKNPYVHQQLSEQMQRGTVDKRYVAFLHGAPPEGAGTVDAPIDRDPASPHVRIVTPDGYPSVTHYETLRVYAAATAAGPDDSRGAAAAVAAAVASADGLADAGAAAGAVASKVALRLETGRTHQIRVHMQHLGCPLIGDEMYRSAARDALPGTAEADAAAGRQALHAERLGFAHPVTGERMTLEAALPADLAALERMLEQRGHSNSSTIPHDRDGGTAT